jgi:protein SPT2
VLALSDIEQYLDNLLTGKSDVSSLSRPTTPGERTSTSGAAQRNAALNNTQIRAGSAPASDSASILKRKAAADLTKEAVKNPRTEIAPRSKDGVSSRPGSSSGIKVQAAQGISAERKGLGSGALTIKKPIESSKPSAGVPSVPARPPAKGSFAEIMARAKTNVVKAKDPGIIKHKTFEKKPPPSKENAKDTKKRDLAKDASKSQASKDSGKNRSVVQDKESKADKTVRKPAQPTYQGTSRLAATQSTYKGTAGIKAAASSRPGQSSTMGSQKSSLAREKSRYDEYDDESEEDFFSDASSNMEAGIMEIDMEEEQTLRAARAEDEAALRQEQEHRRFKEERKRRRW